MPEPPALSALIGTARHRLPAGAEVLASPPAIRPLPGAAPPLRGLAAHRGELVPVLAPGTETPRAWAWIPEPFAALLGVDAVAAAEAEDPPLPPMLFAPHAAPPSALPAKSDAGAEAPRAPRTAPTRLPMLRLGLGPLRFDLPMEAARHIEDAARPRPLPGVGRGALGVAATSQGEALVLDPAWLAEIPVASPGMLLAVFEAGGCRFALPCDRAIPAEAGGGVAVLARLGDPALRAALGMAPRVLARPAPRSEPERRLLIAWAGGTRFALPAGSVAAVIPPRAPDPAPPGAPPGITGLCAHRGDVLPVLDGADWLGAPNPGAPAARPMLRLAVPAPVALMVDALPVLRALPETSVTPVADGAGLLEGIARLDGSALPVCRAEAIAALARRGTS